MKRLLLRFLPVICMLCFGLSLGMQGQQHRHGQQQGKQHRCCQRGKQNGCCKHAGIGRQGQTDEQHQADHDLIGFLFDSRHAIQRTVTELDNGVETLTESDDPEIASKIREHVKSMYSRLEEGRPIHMRDPLFAELFASSDSIKMEMVETEKGMKIVESSEDLEVVQLIKAHARVVSKFIQNGRQEARKNHPLNEISPATE